MGPEGANEESETETERFVKNKCGLKKKTKTKKKQEMQERKETKKVQTTAETNKATPSSSMFRISSVLFLIAVPVQALPILLSSFLL